MNLFLSNFTDEGVLRLSPLGEQAQAFKTFVDSFKERPIPYVPVAVVLEQYSPKQSVVACVFRSSHRLRAVAVPTGLG